MVVAELPLWVAHSSATTGANGILSGGNYDSKSNNSLVSPAGNGKKPTPEEQEKRAKESLALLEGLGGTQKCAIYSVDIHPSGQRFATGGGDGTVRLWSTFALFQSCNASHQQPKAEDEQHLSKQSSYGPNGQYASSGASSSDESDEPSSGNSVENDQDDNDEDGEDLQRPSMANTAIAPTSAHPEEIIHDLSSLVRRKKGVHASPTKQASSTWGGAPSKEDSSNNNSNNNSQVANLKTQAPSSHQRDLRHHRLLCTLSAHTGSSVLAVRFSTNGQYLASAGDDAAVCIYAPAATSGNLESNSVEHWTRIKLCRGHGLDAVGLAWAPDDSHLVSCSLDSNTPIIVWKLTDLAMDQRPTHANVLCNPYKILGKGIHTSMVKGVTFDPAGTYLASSGDDPSVCVWRAHDDWGLEQRIDANSGIFRRWKEGDSQALSSHTLFRRLSWSTDGAYICSTNSVVKNKHVASTVSREGWTVSSAKSAASGAANLVGHKQAVVVCRHCPFLLDARSSDNDGADEEPEYATLLALGDKRGFVTVWSTRRSRPLFKLQCSDSRCTVTDLAWGRIPSSDDLTLVVSLLDGQIVALRFGVPNELGQVLSKDDQVRVFKLRYGIDLEDSGDMGKRRLFVGENSGPKLIENALQFTLENRDRSEEEDYSDESSADMGGQSMNRTEHLSPDQVKASQSETRIKDGKKRIRPVLMVTDQEPRKKSKVGPEGESGEKKKQASKKKSDSLQDAMESAQKALSGAEAVASQKPTGKVRQESVGESSDQDPAGPNSHQNVHQHNRHGVPTTGFMPAASTPQIPHSTDRIHSVDLPLAKKASEGSDTASLENADDKQNNFVADCTNSIQVPAGSSGNALPCAVLSINSGGKVLWKDQLPGTSCSAIAACEQLLAVGSADGCVQLYGTSPTLGWASGAAFRSHPPFVFGSPIVALQLHDDKSVNENGNLKLLSSRHRIDMLVVAADGAFAVYNVVPELRVRYKGTLLSPMMHVSLSSDMAREVHLPKLARILITESNRLLLLLSLQPQDQHHHGGSRSSAAVDDHHGNRFNARANHHGANGTPAVSAGGSMQAFVYNELAELWMRVADSRFVLSDFYSTLPKALKVSKKSQTGDSSESLGEGELSRYDDTVRMGAIASTLKPSRRGGRGFGFASGGHADAVYNQAALEEVHHGNNHVATRSHCEDRMACAVALGSASEFRHWLSLYVKVLSMCGQESLLRIVVDMLLLNGNGTNNGRTSMSIDDSEANPVERWNSCWWISEAPQILLLDRVKLVRTIVITEMSKNRALQRLTNEIAMEVDSANSS